MTCHAAALHSVTALMRRRGQRCTYEALRGPVEEQCRRRFLVPRSPPLMLLSYLIRKRLAVPSGASWIVPSMC